MREQDQEAVRERIEATRARIGDTVEALGERLNPDRLQHEVTRRARAQVDEAKHAVRDKVETMMHDAEEQMNRAGHTIVDTIKENPIPAAMVGAGLAWLIANRSGTSRRTDRYDERYYGGAYAVPRYAATAHAAPGFVEVDVDLDAVERGAAGYGAAERATEDVEHRARSAASSVGDRVREATGRVESKASEVAGRAQEKASQVRHQAQDTVREVRYEADRMMHQAQRQAYRAERRVEDAMRENPLAAGAVALALGFAAGMMAPETEQEHRMMGPTRDRLLDRAQERAHAMADRARDAASEAVQEAGKRVVEQVAGAAGGGQGQGSSTGGTHGRRA